MKKQLIALIAAAALLTSCGSTDSSSSSSAKDSSSAAETTTTTSAPDSSSAEETTTTTTEETTTTTTEETTTTTKSETTTTKSETTTTTTTTEAATTTTQKVTKDLPKDSADYVAKIGEKIEITDISIMAAGMVGAEDGTGFKYNGNKFEVYRYKEGDPMLTEGASGSVVLELEGFGKATSSCVVNGVYLMLYNTADDTVTKAFLSV